MGRQILIGAERRRRWSDGQKLSILREVGFDGARVADIARRHDLTRQHIYQWRAHLRAKGLWSSDGNVAFLPVETHGRTSQLCVRSLAIRRMWRSGALTNFSIT